MNLHTRIKHSKFGNKNLSKLKLTSIIVVFALLVAVIYFNIALPIPEKVLSDAHQINPTFWQYQCVDTMKTSRDKARAWAQRADFEALINQEMAAIVDLGGNCVAIATPYDQEFRPVLQKWVMAARDHRLKIWFRGNFSGWEGWFDYPKGMTTAQHNLKTQQFIATNAELFMDGDVFTPAPEAENGGPFNQVEKDEHEIFRKYLIEEYQIAKNAFAKIDKNVEVNWLSMNGGLAQRMLDQPTVDALGQVVAIDHYIKTAPEMGEFIRYFKQKFGAKLVIGEFGAPIPEINGAMNEDQQAKFIEALMHELYINRADVHALNYWVLWDSSTALYNPNWSEKKAVSSIKKYFKPATLSGKITSDEGEPLKDVRIQTIDSKSAALSREDGSYNIILPAIDQKLQFSLADYETKDILLTLSPSISRHLDISLSNNPKKLKKTILEFLKIHINKLFSRHD